jgi:tetratricopeptide (TPR) repeat protein
MRSLAKGDTLASRFSLITRVGQGGMGEVWLVHDRELDEQVVAKIVPPDASAETIALLQRECRQVRRLVHPNIVRVFDFHRADELGFVTMAYVEGHDLGRYRGRSPAEIVEIILPVVDALIHAHEQGVIHRDLKPSNVRCDSEGRPQLLDFGIAGVLDRQGELALSGGGTRRYASPQQLGGSDPAPVDDIYGLGALLYDLICGEPPGGPVRSDDAFALRSPYPIPGPLSGLVSSLLAADPDERPQTMRDVRGTLVALQEELARETPAAPATKRPARVMPPPRVRSVRPLAPAAPGGQVQGADGEHRGRWVRWVTGAAIGTLVLVAAGVFLFLPGWLEKQRNSTRNAPAGTVQPEPDLEPALSPAEEPDEAERPAAPDPQQLAQRAFDKERAEEALEAAMSAKATLEDKQVLLWGGDDYAAALGVFGVADEHLTSSEYAEAADRYSEAAQLMETLDRRAPDVFRRALDDGQRALAAGDSTAAATAFRLAAAMVPNNPAATTGLRRAEVLDRVLELLDAGARAEREDDLPLAEENYRGAVALDGLSPKAQAALARVRAAISDDAFTQAMSEGLEALEQRDYAVAREAFKRADAVEPGSIQAADALAQVEEAVKLEAIFEHRERALAAVAAEEWHDAVRHYEQVLELDSTIRFAREGLSRATARADLADRLDYHLSHPDRLSSEAVLREATDLLAKASVVEPAGPRLRQQLDDLRGLLRVAATPVRVRLESDNLTEVTVHRVGRLGTFERHELELRPGTYTVVGSRDGYRDVRQQLVVAPGEHPTLVVRCEEEI